MSICRSLTDLQLCELIKSGDANAFAEIYDRYWSVVFTHSLKMLGDEDDAKDVTQEVFTGLWLNGPGNAMSINPAGYLYVSARHKVLNKIRLDKVRHNYLSSLSSYAADLSNLTQDQLNVRDLENALEREIQSLPCKMREIFELSRKQNLSHKDIAVRLEISDKTVKKQISNALKIIRLRLNILLAFLSLLFG